MARYNLGVDNTLEKLFEFPLEEHLFKPSIKNDYLCEDCNRPRAMHLKYPFDPSDQLSLNDRIAIELSLEWRGI